jgi:hypothetical protein
MRDAAAIELVRYGTWSGQEVPRVEAGEVGVGDDAGGERARERLAAEVVEQQLLVGGAEAEPDGQTRDGRAPGGALALHPPRAGRPALHRQARDAG